MLKGLRGETCRSDGTCGDEDSSVWKDGGGAGVAVDRMEGNDETVGEELLDLDFVAVETPAFSFLEADVQSVDHPAEEFVAHPSDDEAGGECSEYFVSGGSWCDTFDRSCGDLLGEVAGRWSADFDGTDGAFALGVDDAVAFQWQLL